MARKNWIQVKLTEDTHEYVQHLLNDVNKDRMDAGLIGSNRDMIGISTIIRDFIECSKASGELRDFAEKYRTNEN